MDNVTSPPPPDEANEAPADGSKKPWRKPSIRVIDQHLSRVGTGQVVNPFVGETPPTHGAWGGYRAS